MTGFKLKHSVTMAKNYSIATVRNQSIAIYGSSVGTDLKYFVTMVRNLSIAMTGSKTLSLRLEINLSLWI